MHIFRFGSYQKFEISNISRFATENFFPKKVCQISEISAGNSKKPFALKLRFWSLCAKIFKNPHLQLDPQHFCAHIPTIGSIQNISKFPSSRQNFEIFWIEPMMGICAQKRCESKGNCGFLKNLPQSNRKLNFRPKMSIYRPK